MTGGFGGLALAENGRDHEVSHLAGVSKILGPRWLQLPSLTIGLLGVSVLWSVEMSYGTPYLISLGLSKSAVAIVFLAGPISGLIVQPVIGVLADNCKSRFGRRRPYMLLGATICISAMLLLGFTRPFASLFTTSGSSTNNILTIWLAIIALFTVDFSINAVQAVDRALLVDILPTSEQADGNAWAARMLGVGSVAGYFIGNVDMTKVLPFLGDTEMEVLSGFASFLLVLTHIITGFCVKEQVVVAAKGSQKSFTREVRELWHNALTLPSVIKQICLIQFFAWVGWFPVLFYTTAFIGELYTRAEGAGSSEDIDAVRAEGIRLGSRAMFYSSILSLAGNIILPFFVSEAGSRKQMQLALERGVRQRWWLKVFELMKVHLATLWAVSHLVFAICMLATFFYSGVWGATFFTTLTGFSWAITQWAPFSLLAEAILSDTSGEDGGSIVLRDTRTIRRSGDIAMGSDDHERQFLVADDEDDGLEAEVRSFASSASMDSQDEPRNSNNLMGNAAARMSHIEVHDPDDIDGHRGSRGGGLAAKAGIILGIHNIFIVLPQFIMTAIASVVFAILEPGKSVLAAHGAGGLNANSTVAAVNSTVTELSRGFHLRAEAAAPDDGPNSYAIVFRLGGVAATIAFVLTIRLARELRHQ